MSCWPGRYEDKLKRSKRKHPPVKGKAKFTLLIMWKDAHIGGVKGVVELNVSRLLLRRAQVRDLFPVLNKRINDKYQTSGSYREVERFLLYGTRVSSDRRLDELIPELAVVPRFIAEMHVYSKKMSRRCVSVSIKTQTNENLVLHCESSDTVESVKATIEKKLKISQESQRLIHAGKELEDHLALSAYEITDMSKIYLVQMMNRTEVLADVRDILSCAKARACHGLNIEGKCENPQCAAFRQNIIYSWGFQVFNLIREKATQCPTCQSKVTPLTCGFYNCAWKFDGIQVENGFSIISQWMDARGQKYHRFNPVDYRDSVKWESLLIVVKRLDESVAPCAICWAGLGSPDGGFGASSCGHSFHRSCIDKWAEICAQSGNLVSCSICREELGTELA